MCSRPPPVVRRSSGSFNNVWVRDESRKSWGTSADAGADQQLSWAEQQERTLSNGAGSDEEEEDTTAWRRGAGSGDEAEADGDEPLDDRVGEAFEALNTAIASNNEVEAAVTAAQRGLELQKTAHASELGELQRQCRRQLRRLASFERAKREARTAADSLEGVSAQLAEATEHAELAREGLDALREARGEADRESWNEAEERMRSRHESLAAALKKLRADQRYFAAQVEKATRGVVRRAKALGDVANGAMPFLAAEKELADADRRREAEVLGQQARAQQAKADVKQAMSRLEQISLEIASSKVGAGGAQT